MVNFQEFKRVLEGFNNKDVLISTVGRFSSILHLHKCKVMEFKNVEVPSLNICNMNNLLEENNAISIILNSDEIKDFEIIDCFDSEEIRVNWINGEIMIIIGCGV